MVAPIVVAAGIGAASSLFGKKKRAPQISPEQRELQRAQKEFLDLQTSLIGGAAGDIKGLQGPLLELLGIQGFGEDGSRVEGGFLGRLSELENLLFGRTKGAFAGEIDNPALLRDIREQQETLQNQLRKELGTGFRTSTPGIEALGSFGERSLIAKDVSRRADISQLIPQLLNVGQSRGQTLAQILGIAGAPAGLPFGQVNTGFAQAQQPFIAQNQIAAQFGLEPGFLESLAGNVAGGLAGGGTSALLQNLTQGGLGGSPASTFTGFNPGFEPNPTFNNPSF